MKASAKLTYSSFFEIDLEDYGHDENVKFEDLTEEQKNEIYDHLREEAVVSVDIVTEDNLPW